MFKYLILFTFILSASSFSQITTEVERYRNDPKGDIQYRREGVMDGNLVRSLFYNQGEVGKWKFQPSGEWPKGSGHSYVDGICVLISAEVTAPGNSQVIHPLETNYREWMDPQPPLGNVVWGLEPVPGYMNVHFTKPAMSTDPKSWPDIWPVALNIEPEWNGNWYGYFGRDNKNADFETFYVMDDSKDKEFSRAPYNYYPIASDLDRGGLGLRVETRGFQWSHVLAEDIIFWHYDIVNISDFDYEKSIFGFYTDPGVGGWEDSGDDNASFDQTLDMAYCFDDNGLGAPVQWKTGYYGYAYLESPGNSWNGFDDDEDGLTDETRDDGLDNDNDWIKFSDLNGNGLWDKSENEPLNNDVGKDGVGPFDPQYIAPDAGEGDGVPTLGEPNFDKTDKDESDQIGLTSVSIYILGDGGVGGGWPKDDESMWNKMSYHNFDTSIQKSNISMVFASGPFPLKMGKRERYSMALLFGSDLDELIFNKETVQQIYNANYNFAKPPLKPTLKAVAGDGKVFLYWNKIAEESRDPFLGYQNNDPTMGYKKDFEGYLVYRSTEPEFQDIKVITDSKGSPKYWKPIAQFDLQDSIKGPDPVGINGAHFWMGDNTGLRYTYIDEDVDNGVTYYYALVSYDMGDPNYGTTGLQPSECTKIISQDFAGNIQFIDINTAVVTPDAPAAGYIPPEIKEMNKNGGGTGSLDVHVFNPAIINDNAEYRIVFNSAGGDTFYNTSSYDIVKFYNGTVDTLEKNIDTLSIGKERFSPAFDGISVSVTNDTTVTVIDSVSGWLVNNSNLRLSVGPDTLKNAKGKVWPADYQIDFFDTYQDTSLNNIPVMLKVLNLTSNTYSDVYIKDLDNSHSLTPGDTLQILEYIALPKNVANTRFTWAVYFGRPMYPVQDTLMPAAGDKYIFKTTRQFKTGDYISFKTSAIKTDNNLAKDQLNKIDVVPNPYLGAATWEKRNLNSSGRGDRKIDFINLPSKCIIRIYTVTGALVKTLYKDTQVSDGSLSWNLVTEDGMDIAYGVYIYHIDAEGIGEHIGKFAVIK